MSTISKLVLSKRGQFNAFLKEHPALLIAWGIVVCISLYFKYLSVIWAVLFLLVLVEVAQLLRVVLPLFFIFGVFLSFWLGGVNLNSPVDGKAKVSIYEKKLSKSAFGQAWVLKGFIKEFQGENHKKMRHLPFSAYLPKETKLPKLDRAYWIDGQLQKSDFYGYRLKIKKGGQFERVEKTWSLAEFRYQIKAKLKSFLKKKIPYPKARSLLIGMSTGDFDDSFLSFTFSRFGLNHLLAISGFHFGILALFIGVLLKWLPFKIRVILLGFLLTLFYFFVGYSPSLQRAWLVAIIYLFGSYQNQMMTTINVLSIALCLSLIYNPYMLFNMGFQFSFAVTFAILIYYQPIYKKMESWAAPKNKIDTVVIQLIALGLAVHLAAIPLSLFHFHKFYFLGFIFNLFIPAFVSFLLMGFMSGLLIYPLFQTLASGVLFGVGFLTEQMLRFIFWIPTSCDYCIRTSFVSLPLIVIYFSFFMIIASSFQVTRKEVFIDYAIN